MTLDETITLTEKGINNFLQNKCEAENIYDYLVSIRSYLLELKNPKDAQSEASDENISVGK